MRGNDGTDAGSIVPPALAVQPRPCRRRLAASAKASAPEEQPGAQLDRQPHPQGLPENRDQMRPDFRRLGRPRDHGQRRTEREDRRADAERAVERSDRERGQHEDQNLADRDRHRQGLDFANRGGLRSDAQEQRAEQQVIGGVIDEHQENEEGPAHGRRRQAAAGRRKG